MAITRTICDLSCGVPATVETYSVLLLLLYKMPNLRPMSPIHIALNSTMRYERYMGARKVATIGEMWIKKPLNLPITHRQMRRQSYTRWHMPFPLELLESRLLQQRRKIYHVHLFFLLQCGFVNLHIKWRPRVYLWVIVNSHNGQAACKTEERFRKHVYFNCRSCS